MNYVVESSVVEAPFRLQAVAFWWSCPPSYVGLLEKRPDGEVSDRRALPPLAGRVGFVSRRSGLRGETLRTSAATRARACDRHGVTNGCSRCARSPRYRKFHCHEWFRLSARIAHPSRRHHGTAPRGTQRNPVSGDRDSRAERRVRGHASE